VSCGCVILEVSTSFKSLWDVPHVLKEWHYLPSENERLVAERAKEETQATAAANRTGKPGWPKVLGVLTFDRLEVDKLKIDFSIKDGEFNINKFSRTLAEGECLECLAKHNMEAVKGKGSGYDDGGGGASSGGGGGDGSKMRSASTSAAPSSASGGGGGGGRRATTTVMHDDATATAGQHALCLPNQLEIACLRGRNLRNGNSRVAIQIRQVSHRSTMIRKTSNPLWNYACSFDLKDPSAVIHVCVIGEDLVGGGRLLGQWVMTLKWLLVNPFFCHHNKLDVISPGHVKGWFPLVDKSFKNLGKCGEIELELRWHYDPLKDCPPPRGGGGGEKRTPMTALEQLTENSAETTLKLGNTDAVILMLRCFPYHFNVRRCTLRDTKFFLKVVVVCLFVLRLALSSPLVCLCVLLFLCVVSCVVVSCVLCRRRLILSGLALPCLTHDIGIDFVLVL
jgi:hypothetical protein